MISFSVAISACEKGGQWQRALALFGDMRKVGVTRRLGSVCRAGVTPSVISFSAAISACEKGGQWQHALSPLEDICRAGECDAIFGSVAEAIGAE